MIQLRNVDQAICARKYLHESPEVSYFPHRAQIKTTNFSLSRKFPYHLYRHVTAGKVRAHDGHFAIVFDVNLGVGFGNNLADDLAARTYDVTDFVGMYFNGQNSGCKR